MTLNYKEAIDVILSNNRYLDNRCDFTNMILECILIACLNALLIPLVFMVLSIDANVYLVTVLSILLVPYTYGLIVPKSSPSFLKSIRVTLRDYFDIAYYYTKKFFGLPVDRLPHDVSGLIRFIDERYREEYILGMLEIIKSIHIRCDASTLHLIQGEESKPLEEALIHPSWQTIRSIYRDEVPDVIFQHLYKAALSKCEHDVTNLSDKIRDNIDYIRLHNYIECCKD